MTRSITLIAAVLALVAAPLSAQTDTPIRAQHRDIMLRQLLSGKVRIDPAKAYVFIRSPQGRAAGTFVKTPTPEEIASYEARGPDRGLRSRVPWPIDVRLLATFGPKSFFDRAGGEDGSFTYLMEVEPGEYTYLGPMLVSTHVPTPGECYCMGSVKFEAKAGQITSLGDFLSLRWANRKAMLQTTIDHGALPYNRPEPVDWSVPESLAQYPHARAELRAAGRRDNFFNALIGRIPPVPGVLAYDRDAVIDLLAPAEGGAATTPSAAADALSATLPPLDNESSRPQRGRSEADAPNSKLRKEIR